MNAREKLDAILADLAAKQRKAAMTNKPTMWAYYHTMRGELLRWFDGTTDGATAGAALALIQIAEKHQDDPPAEAARWAAMAVYARRVFREWAPGRKLDKRSGTIGSLAWLRRRADELPNRQISAPTGSANGAVPGLADDRRRAGHAAPDQRGGENMKTLLTDKYDLMAGTVDKITKVLFDEKHGDSETVAQVLAIIAEHEIQADQLERAYGQ